MEEPSHLSLTGLDAITLVDGILVHHLTGVLSSAAIVGVRAVYPKLLGGGMIYSTQHFDVFTLVTYDSHVMTSAVSTYIYIYRPTVETIHSCSTFLGIKHCATTDDATVKTVQLQSRVILLARI